MDDVLKKVRNLKPIADELDVPMSQLAIAWCAANPNVSSVITGATKEYQVRLHYSKDVFLLSCIKFLKEVLVRPHIFLHKFLKNYF